MKRLIWGQATICSPVRDINQDSLLTFYDPELELGLFIVADGMGSKEGGAKASQLSTQIINKQVMAALHELRAKTKQPNDVLVNAFQIANKEIINLRDVDGASVTAAIVNDQNIYIAHVGVTRAYLITEHEIKSLTKVHDFLHRVIEAGYVKWEDVINTRVRNAIAPALGQHETVEVDALTIPFVDCSFLLCSEGLFSGINDPVDEQTIRQMMIKTTPQQACDDLTQYVSKNRDWYRDISVIVVRSED